MMCAPKPVMVQVFVKSNIFTRFFAKGKGNEKLHPQEGEGAALAGVLEGGGRREVGGGQERDRQGSISALGVQI